MKYKIVAFALCLFATNSAHAERMNQLGPFSIKNQNAFIQIFGLPTTPEANLASDEKASYDITLDIANNSVIDKAGAENIILDGETYRLSLTLRQEIKPKIEVGVELPFVAHSNGFMDNFIEDWHKTFGLTNSKRNETTSNTLSYGYDVNGNTQLAFSQPNEGIGDIQLFTAYQLNKTASSALSVRAGLKLPTGKTEVLHGSGGTDFSLAIAHSKERWLSSYNLSTYLHSGIILLGDADYLTEIQKNAIGFGGAAIVWDSHSWIDLKAQIDGHTPFYDSELKPLGANTVQLTVGGSVHLDRYSRIDIGVGENLFTDTTPDFLINLGYKHRLK